MSGFKDYTRTLAANAVVDFVFLGNAIQCTQGVATFIVEAETVEGKETSQHQIENGLGFRYKTQFYKWRITNGSTAQTITVYIGDGDVIDNRLAGAVSNAPVLADTRIDGQTSVVGAATAVEILASDTSRLGATIQTDLDIYVGAADTVTNAGATQGILLAAGSTTQDFNTAALFAYAAVTATVNTLVDDNP